MGYNSIILYKGNKNIKDYVEYLKGFCDNVFIGYKDEKPEIDNSIKLTNLSFDELYEKINIFKEDDIILFIQDDEIIPEDAFEEAEFEDILPLKLKCVNNYINHICKDKYKTGPFLCKGFIKDSKDKLYKKFKENKEDYYYECGYFITKCNDFIYVKEDDIDINIKSLIQRKIKIAVIDTHPDTGILVGAERIGYDFAKMFQHDYELHYFVLSYTLFNKLSDLDIEIDHLPIEDTKFLSALGNHDKWMPKFIKAIKDSKPDLYLINDILLPFELYEKEFDKPVIQYIHSNIEILKDYNEVAYQKLQDWKKTTNTIFITVADYISNYLIEKEGFSKDKTFAVPNWIETIEEKPKTYNKDRFIIGWSSRLLPEKGWMDLVEVLKDTDIKAYFLGDGDDLEKAKTLKKEQNLKHIEFLGWVNNPREFLKENVDVFVFTSKASYESFGMSLLEAMSIGIPAIAYNIPASRYVLDNDECIYNNIDELRDLIFRLKNDEEFYNKLASYSLERAKYFNVEMSKIRWKNIIEYVVNNFK